MTSGSGSSAEVKGNVALAGGTLMGELGPELYVTGGRYYVAGQHGAEFVNLPSDAIVFNHMQTSRLLGSGHSGRGTPVVSEAESIAYATGNAQATASQTLATLKQLRAMWETIANSSIVDLAKLGGTSTTSGGSNTAAEIGAFIKDLERWYNWLQKIA